jgi:ArsR family transcriptional regulator
MARTRLTPERFEQVAARFKAFGEPARLRILYALRAGERTVGQLCDATGLSQANLSRHLHYMLALGLVARRKQGVFVRFSLAGPGVLRLCDVVCGQLEREARALRR